MIVRGLPCRPCHIRNKIAYIICQMSLLKMSRIAWKDSFLRGTYLFEIIAHCPGPMPMVSGCFFHCRLWHCSRFFCKAWWFIWQSKLRTNALVNLMSLEQRTQRDIPFHIHYISMAGVWPQLTGSEHEHALYMGYNLLPRPIPKRRTKSLHALAYLEPQRRLSGPVRGSGLQEQLACHVEIARTDSTHQTSTILCHELERWKQAPHTICWCLIPWCEWQRIQRQQDFSHAHPCAAVLQPNPLPLGFPTAGQFGVEARCRQSLKECWVAGWILLPQSVTSW